MSETMRVTLNWLDGAAFTGVTDSGHEVVMDGPSDAGGRNRGPRPMEMLLLGTGGCAAFDIVHILRKARQQVDSCEAVLEARRADTIPAVFERVHFHFRVRGARLSESRVARAVSLSAEKYCSASIMLRRAGVEVLHDYEILPP